MIQPTAEQALMRDNLVRLLGDGVARARAAANAWPKCDREFWQQLCDAGWPGLLLPEDAGGWGCGATDMVMLIEGSAAHLPPPPLVSALAVAPLLARCGTSVSAALLDQLLEGRSVVLVAERDPFPLTQQADVVLQDAAWADTILCGEGGGPSFRLHAMHSADLDARWPLRRTIDDEAQRVFPAPRDNALELGRGAELEAAFSHAGNLMRLGAAAGLVGIARHALSLTVDYLKTRKQFGQPIGSFQALQHRAASMHVACVAAWALVCEASLSVGGPKEHAACTMAKAKASTTARQTLNACVQMHGAIGFSDEHALAIYFRRAVALASSWGTADRCLAELSGRATANVAERGEPTGRVAGPPSREVMAG